MFRDTLNLPSLMLQIYMCWTSNASSAHRLTFIIEAAIMAIVGINKDGFSQIVYYRDSWLLEIVAR